ncbi:Peptidoglycan-binding domain 1 protein [Yersinia mollaretii ATCC 43969]|uniref:Peptidoglycan-binding domain 1 protein n=1 Tax=Yersinia mollaretii (strain ATCC 43969 / DSM 18520 / CIP 103324 / CNY 7263 / WAIP 204) TaxID=349967 RepID=A0ABM9YE86_YERMW|nr:Peptidoglycan-binding domain 1 protein [Yersinia mollaretii ATCC 43969]
MDSTGDESTGVIGAAADAANTGIELQIKAQYNANARCGFRFPIDILCPRSAAYLNTS